MQTVSDFAKERGISRHQVLFYPWRCEFPNCPETKDLKCCGACKMICYCCVEHQKKDWKVHKLECKVFKRLGIQALFYNDVDILKKFPLTKPFSSSDLLVPVEGDDITKCGICGIPQIDCDLIVTKCCHRTVCDTEVNYQLMSYSRDFCPRSHARYTLCALHADEKTCERDKDWRECKNCLRALLKIESFSSEDIGCSVPYTLWRGLNSYNLCPLQSKNVPRHSICESCNVCGGKFFPGIEGYSKGTKRITCPTCGTANFYQISGLK